MPAKKKATKSATTTKRVAASLAAKTTRSSRKIPAKASAAPARVSRAKPEVTEEKRFQMVQLEAYLIAERDGFRGDPKRYWQAAEKKVADLILR